MVTVGARYYGPRCDISQEMCTNRRRVAMKKQDERKGSGSNRRFPIKSVCVIAAAVVIFLLAYRVYAAGGEESSEESRTDPPSVVANMMDAAIHRLLQVDVSMDYEKLGDVETVDQVIDLLTMQSEYFILIFYDGESYKTTTHYVKDLSSSGGIMASLESELRENVLVGDGIYKIVIDGQSTHMTISSDGGRFSGVFPMASRIDNKVAMMLGINESVPGEIEACEYKPLSRTIFNRTAEAIKACVEVQCSNREIDSETCMLTDVQSWHGFFGYVVVENNPEDLPVQANVSGDTCKGCITYKWGIGVNIEGKISIDITGRGGSGVVCAEANCTTE